MLFHIRDENPLIISWQLQFHLTLIRKKKKDFYPKEKQANQQKRKENNPW